MKVKQTMRKRVAGFVRDWSLPRRLGHDRRRARPDRRGRLAVAAARAMNRPLGNAEAWPAPGKLNLFLHVVGRRPDGYHELQTAFQFIDLCDRLWFYERPAGVFERLGVSFDESLPAARELVANRFASSLLLPRRWFAADGSDVGWDLLALKDRYCTASHELIARRMLEMRPPVVITLCDHGRVRWRRSNTSSRLPSLLAEEQSVWQESHLTGLPASVTLDAESGLESVDCWPIHEPDWKREILRSAVAEI